MFRNLTLSMLLPITLLCFVPELQAQRQLPRPQNIRVENDAVVWNAVAGASGYRVEWVRAAARLRYILEEVTPNRFDMSEFHYGELYYVKVQAVSGDSAEYQDSRWHTFRYITFPLLNPSIVYLLVLQTISFLRMFAPVVAMTQQGRGGPLDSTVTVVLQTYREAFQSFNMGYAASLTVVLFALILGVTIIQLSVTSRRIN